MTLKADSIFYDVLNLATPWQIVLVAYTKSDKKLKIYIDYTSDTATCPICGLSGQVYDKKILVWPFYDFFDSKTEVLSYVPVTIFHTLECKASWDHSVMSNTLLLDLMLKQLCDFDRKLLFYRFFETKECASGSKA